MNKKSRSCLSRILIAFFALLGLCSLLTVLSITSNQDLPAQDSSDTLSQLDQARLLEALHLKTMLGDQLWHGWGSADIPVIVWNRSHEFLANYKGETPLGWSMIAGLNSPTYFRRLANDPQNFAVRVGDVWVASMATKQTTDRFLIDAFRDNFPAPIKQIFPYRILIQPSETQIGGLLHETFHVYQYQNAPRRMTDAESIHKLGEEYQATASLFQPEWRKEGVILADALKAESNPEKIDLVRQFLQVRDARRQEYRLGNQLTDYERWLEWEEGTAKYMEVAILRLAGATGDYQPVPEMNNDTDFKQYRKTDQRWSQEIMQLRYQTTSGETQFYMSGMAQAFLLDDLLPGWKVKYWADGVFLEDLLRQAVAGK